MRKSREAFVMPAIMIVGTVLFIVLAYAINAVISARGIITTSHIQTLTRQAAESGVAYARSCIIQNNRVVTWTEEKPLRPNTDCRGDVIHRADGSTMSAYLLDTDTYRSYFVVRPSDVDDSYKTVAAHGFLEVLNKRNGSTLRTHNHRMSAYIKTDVTFSDIVFGSLYTGNGLNDLYNRNQQTAGFRKAVYFFTKTHLGDISSVGYNIDGVLTGFPSNGYQSLNWNLRHTSDPKEWYHTPYSLKLPTTSTVSISKIFTDFQGNGWISFLLGSDGRTVYGTGSNINCDLGIGACDGAINSMASRPVWLDGESKMDLSNIPSDEKIINIFYNASTFVLTDTGKLYATGTNSMSPGFGSSASSSTSWVRPTAIEGYDGFNLQKIKKFYTDGYYNLRDGTMAVAVAESGQLYIWGTRRNQYGSFISQYIDGVDSRPRRFLSDKIIVDAVTDGGTVWALDSDGVVWSAGNNRYGQLGRNSTSSSINSFGSVSIPDNKKVVKMAADGFSVLFLTEDGSVYGAGLNDVAQLGFAKNTQTCDFSGGWWYVYKVPCSRFPRKFNVPDDVAIQDLFIVSPAIKSDTGSGDGYALEADNYRNSFVITTSGEVYGAGSNYHGQIGVGAPGDNDDGYGGVPQESDVPRKMILDYNNNESGVPGDEGRIVRARYVRSGIGTTIVITDLNHVFTVGNNATGQLGSGDTIEYHTPKRHRYTNVFQTWYY